jgi:hypothetical protein
VIGQPLAGREPFAVQSALLSHGWEGASSATAQAGLEPWGHHFTGLLPEQVEGLLRSVPRFGLDLLTGGDWAIVWGTRSRLSAFARSWNLPPELAELAIAIGTGLPADAAVSWRTGARVFDLSQPVIMDRLPADVEIISGAGTGTGAATGRETGGILLRAGNPDHALEELERGLDLLLTADIDMDRVALDPRWTPGSPPLGLHLRFERPLVCTTADPVVAVLARQQGAQIFLTSRPDAIQRALAMIDSRAGSREP